MKTEGRSSPTRALTLVRVLGVAVIALVLTMIGGVIGVAAHASGGAVGHVGAKASAPSCSSITLSETATTNAKSYGPGTVVTMTASIHNSSTHTCSMAIGATSP